MSEALGDGQAPLFVLVPDPPLPIDRATLAELATVRTIGHDLVVTTGVREAAAAALRRLLEARCDVVTVAAIGDGATLGPAALAALVAALLRRPLRWPEGHALAGLVFDWGEPIARLDAGGAHPLPRRTGRAR
ncbi:MAG: hypothetical protein IPK74_21105 [Deltaproteobacteria bacterium]|nr:hypothetical protein [Deltaproteobacteria bacterium]